MITVGYSTVSRISLAAPALPLLTLARLEQLYATWQASTRKSDYISALPVAEAAALCDYITGQAKAGTIPPLQTDTLTIDQACDALNLSRGRVTALCKLGSLTGSRTGRCWSIKRASVEAYAAGRRRRAR